MDPINKTAMRAAMLIHEQLADGKRQDPSIHLPEYAWNNLQQIRRQIELARQHGWHAAASKLTEDVAGALEDCRRELDIAAQALQFRPTECQASSASDIYRDIMALYNEFEEVEIDLKEHELSVTTDRIVLEDYYLGHFQIRLNWRRLGSPQPYRVVALDPHPAAKSEDITHPHVQDEQLCEGEGRSAIRAAQAECRLFDFFVLISQVLHTYGRGSAYVELDNWFGRPCEGCGASVEDDDRYYCHRCEATLCSSCSWTCQDCGESCCSECIGTCAACSTEYCSSCLETCPKCHKPFCDDCREEGGLCKSCHDKQRQEEKKDDPPQKETQQRPATVPRRVAAEELPQRQRDEPWELPTLRFSPTAWAKLLYLRNLGNSEVGGFGITAADDLLLVEDVQLVQQVCTGASVAFDDQSVAEFFDQQVDQGRRPEQFGRAWIHTHPGNCPQPSMTDEGTFARVFGRTDWAVMFILARQGQSYGRLRFHVGPVGGAIAGCDGRQGLGAGVGVGGTLGPERPAGFWVRCVGDPGKRCEAGYPRATCLVSFLPHRHTLPEAFQRAVFRYVSVKSCEIRSRPANYTFTHQKRRCRNSLCGNALGSTGGGT